MRFLSAISAAVVLFFASSAAAQSRCDVDISSVVATSPYFQQSMQLVGNEDPSFVTFRHVDDPRIVATFEITAPPPAHGRSRVDYLRARQAEAEPYLNAVRADGRWIEFSEFPYDPVSWRIIEESRIEDVGQAFTGRMYVRLSESCMISAEFLAPTSVNLRSRWNALSRSVADLRLTAGRFAKVEAWAEEDTTPTGGLALLAGFGAPLAVLGVAYLLLGHLTRLDPPNLATRITVGSSATLMAGTLAYQSSAYALALPMLRYIDNLALLSFGIIICIASLFFAQKMAVLALASTGIIGMTLITASVLDWTPDPLISASVGGCLLFMGGLGFFAWNRTSSALTKRG